MQPEVHYAMADLGTIDIGPHVFPTEKYELVRDGLLAGLDGVRERMHPAREVSVEDLERVHTPRYVRDLCEARLSWATERSELPVNHEVIDAFRRMAGGSLAAVENAHRFGVGAQLGDLRRVQLDRVEGRPVRGAEVRDVVEEEL